MVVVDLALTLAAALPRVEDPWPDTIGLELPFAMAGAGGFLAGAFSAGGSSAEHDEAFRNGGLWGFWLGTLFYAFSVLNQVLSTS